MGRKEKVMHYAIDKQDGKIAECRYCDHVAIGATAMGAFEKLAEHMREKHPDAVARKVNTPKAAADEN